MRSQDPDRNDYIHECPCQVECQHWVSKDSHDFPVADKELAEDGHRQQQVAGGPLHQGAHQAGQGGHLRDHQDDKETAMLLNQVVNIVLILYDLCRLHLVQYIF